ncbi:TIGR04086 family membrane protein [Pontibacillus marinus]|uniref:Membrane protein n=1 Tax=Pontibacillus marinus BH030004 = DSM 16465 TaxID=1385511 RepID=A0A0A5FZT6_9BACI|nr:TIGR04086 family membrane protein [Pontibacillus marinus]KGX84348.1 membrane protein [Pontibacillus marinus BH030004 = DSM 16465]
MFQERMKALGYGWVTILVMMLASSLVLALFLRFTDMTAGTLQWVTLVLGLLTLFIGGFVSGAKGKERGWMLGLFTGLGFVLIVLLFQYLGYQKGMSTTQMMYQGGYTLAAMLGGVIGVNMAGDKQS